MYVVQRTCRARMVGDIAPWFVVLSYNFFVAFLWSLKSGQYDDLDGAAVAFFPTTTLLRATSPHAESSNVTTIDDGSSGSDAIRKPSSRHISSIIVFSRST